MSSNVVYKCLACDWNDVCRDWWVLETALSSALLSNITVLKGRLSALPRVLGWPDIGARADDSTWGAGCGVQAHF